MMKAVPSSYNNYLVVFSKVKAEKLPPYHACDHHIELEGSLPIVGVIYSLSNQESDTLRAYISENVNRAFIRSSCSSPGEPVLSGKKKDVGLCLCVDYCKLNAVTMKEKYHVLPMNQLLTVFNSSSISSNIYLCGAYNLLRIKKYDVIFTAFRPKYYSYEYLVIPFGLTNAPASFQNLDSDILSELLDFYVSVYLDDIMLFPRLTKSIPHVSTVPSRLRSNNPFSKASKRLFHVSSVEYLGYVFSSGGLMMYQEEVKQIFNWTPPRNLKAVKSSLGFANYYSCFINNSSKTISPLTKFLKKYSCFPLNEDTLKKLKKVKEAFTTAPILLYPPL
ncbi:hypothetical protein O181_024644 [Austropuccinia psidii MF-1]|uniref:Reverse transcriptase domain-containing protein n=1 Tax=Austropuccinia psidii MF-1 TaxID=1389203 RepID=A0A9Q3GZV6_9BASI|nr:hypothetical protein [Austropuccinia psidii MF-1]